MHFKSIPAADPEIELRGDMGGIVLSALSAFLSSVISSLFSQIKGAPAPRALP